MKALVFDNKLAMKEIPDPEPGPGEALIRVLMAGICKTDCRNHPRLYELYRSIGS